VWHNWAALAALAVCGWFAARALAPVAEGSAPAAGTPPTTSAPARTEVGAAALQVRAEGAALDRMVLRVVERDPFRPERSRARDRYRTPAQAAAAAALAATVPPSPQMPVPPPYTPPEVPLVLRGIAADGQGRALVAVEIGGQHRLLRVGEEFGGLRLLSATRSEARFRGPNGIRTVRLGQ
jgi:hypothetical protein